MLHVCQLAKRQSHPRGCVYQIPLHIDEAKKQNEKYSNFCVQLFSFRLLHQALCCCSRCHPAAANANTWRKYLLCSVGRFTARAFLLSCKILFCKIERSKRRRRKDCWGQTERQFGCVCVCGGCIIGFKSIALRCMACVVCNDLFIIINCGADVQHLPHSGLSTCLHVDGELPFPSWFSCGRMGIWLGGMEPWSGQGQVRVSPRRYVCVNW